jgi:hypothetical protein
LSPEGLFLEWASDGSGIGTLGQLSEAFTTTNLLDDNMDMRERKSTYYELLADLTDCSILDFSEGGRWQIQRTQLALIRHDGTGLHAVLCGARDSLINAALVSLPMTITTAPIGRFGLGLQGAGADMLAWAAANSISVQSHWIPIQVRGALDELGFPTVTRAAELGETSGLNTLGPGPYTIKRLDKGFAAQATSTLPEPKPGLVVECTDQYSARRTRFVATEHGWLRSPYRWAPWIAAASVRLRIARTVRGTIETPFWARLPDQLARAVCLASGSPWRSENGMLRSGSVSPILLYNVERILALNT